MHNLSHFQKLEILPGEKPHADTAGKSFNILILIFRETNERELDEKVEDYDWRDVDMLLHCEFNKQSRLNNV